MSAIEDVCVFIGGLIEMRMEEIKRSRVTRDEFEERVCTNERSKIIRVICNQEIGKINFCFLFVNLLYENCYILIMLLHNNFFSVASFYIFNSYCVEQRGTKSLLNHYICEFLTWSNYLTLSLIYKKNK